MNSFIFSRGIEFMVSFFLVYNGEEFSPKKIKSALYEVFLEANLQSVSILNTHFFVIGDNNVDKTFFQDDFGNMFVVNYDSDDLKKYLEANNLRYPDDISSFFLQQFQKKGPKIFASLSHDIHFCAVAKDCMSLIAGVTESNNLFNHLYYGYTKQNHELMFSNMQTILSHFCSEVKEMPRNTYMKNGESNNFNGEKIRQEQKTLMENTNNEEKISKEPKPFIENNSEYASLLINSINRLLLDITDKSVRTKIEQNIEDYLSSDDPKKKISDFLVKELDSEVQKQILEKIKNALETHNLEERIDSQLEDALDNKLEETLNNKLEEYTNKIQMPVTHIIKLKDIVLGQTSGGYYHEKFEQILTQVQLDEPIMLIGPAGSGKNVCISQVAEALGQHMYYTNNASNEFKLTGFIDAGGNYRDTEFYKAFKNGGIFFLDEIDNSDPSALIVINSALANGYMAFPHETIDRHPDFRIIAAANTWGKGADLEYVGRNALDAATLDRFDNIFFDYDTKLEQALYPSDEVLEFMWSFRNAVYQSKIPHIVSTRGIGKVYKKEINEIPVEDILTSNVVKNLGQDDVNTIIGNMENIRSSNTYYYGIRRLKLGR